MKSGAWYGRVLGEENGLVLDIAGVKLRETQKIATAVLKVINEARRVSTCGVIRREKLVKLFILEKIVRFKSRGTKKKKKKAELGGAIKHRVELLQLVRKKMVNNGTQYS